MFYWEFNKNNGSTASNGNGDSTEEDENTVTSAFQVRGTAAAADQERADGEKLKHQ